VTTVEGVLKRLLGEYLEMPGLRLTVSQVQRLCGIERTRCQSALDVLVDGTFLCLKSDGTYALPRDGEIVSPARAH
jgi:hypothetical protein